jgi:hypothetical protein
MLLNYFSVYETFTVYIYLQLLNGASQHLTIIASSYQDGSLKNDITILVTTVGHQNQRLDVRIFNKTGIRPTCLASKALAFASSWSNELTRVVMSKNKIKDSNILRSFRSSFTSLTSFDPLAAFTTLAPSSAIIIAIKAPTVPIIAFTSLSGYGKVIPDASLAASFYVDPFEGSFTCYSTKQVV